MKKAPANSYRKSSASNGKRKSYYWLVAAGMLFFLVLIVYPYRNWITAKMPNRMADPMISAPMDGFGISIPGGYSVYGIDVSRHQGKINWKKVAESHGDGLYVTFAFLKATEGATRKDEHFDRNWQLTRKYGLLRGAYHFLRPNRPAEAQFQNFADHVTLDPGDLPPVLDVEQRQGTNAYMAALCRKWLKLAEEHYGVKPIIYTNRAYYRAFIKNEFAGEYPIWFAHYDHTTFSLSDEEWHFWQFSDKAKIKGIEGPVDLNVFNGDSTTIYDMMVD